VIISYLTTIIGVPLPAHAGKDTGEKYPCQGHPCGCATAEECWRHCCCFSPEQKLAWARQHGVTPPSYAEPVAPKGWQAPRIRDQVEKRAQDHCPNCEPGSKERCCEAKSNCCSKKTQEPCCAKPTIAESKKPASKSNGWTITLRARSCKNQATLWVSLGAVAPPPMPAEWKSHETISDSLDFSHYSPVRLIIPPPDPPPRS
jgi:hypothetical protein